MFTFPQDFEARTGFVHVRAEVQAYAVTRAGRDQVAASCYSTDYNAIASNLSRLRELKAFLLFHSLSEEYFVDATTALLKLQHSDRAFSEEEAANVRTMLRSVLYLHSLWGEGVEVQALHDWVARVLVPEEVLHEIDTVLDRTGHVKDNASPELLRLRSQLRTKAGRVSHKMEELLARCQREGYSDANAQVMVRDGRLVLPIAAQHKRRIPSLQLGSSSTGQTLFVTPYEVLELENELKELEQAELAEVARILSELTDRCRPFYPELLQASDLLISVDVLRAKVLYAIAVGGAAPILTQERRLLLRDAQHPVLLKRMQRGGKTPVPLNLILDPSQRIVVISGPNAGGKSVALQTVALASYMLQSGFLPLVKENSEMCLFENLLLDIGDAQSIEDDLSTYSSHLQAMKAFTERATPTTLFLIDEMGAGTEPTAGGAIAEAILVDLYHHGAYGIVTTHYACLKNLASQTEGMQNASMRYDIEHFAPQYTLDVGAPGSSYAFAIARKLGLRKSLIAYAEELAGKDYISLEEQLRRAIDERRAWEKKQQELESLRQEVATLQAELAEERATLTERKQKVLAEARKQAQAMLRDCNRTIEETVRLIRESNAEKETTKRVREELKFYQSFVDSETEAAKPQKVQSAPVKPTLAIGDTVKLLGGNMGQVVNVKGEKVVVAVGQLMTTMNIADVEVVTNPAAGRTKGGSASAASQRVSPLSSMRQRRLNFSPNLDIRGMRGDEAMELVRQYLDDAQMFNIPFVSILHGKGTGILRNLVHDYLRHATFVDSYTNTSPTCADGGVTEVYLK